jgi:hypothetical protein
LTELLTEGGGISFRQQVALAPQRLFRRPGLGGYAGQRVSQDLLQHVLDVRLGLHEGIMTRLR